MIVRQAPAKVNLWLKICGKRPDGFHELDTLFAPLDLCDEIRVGPANSGIALEVRGAGTDVPTGPDNLVWRAAELFLSRAGLRQGVSIQLSKRIPSGAGLGGGSSDAANVLLGLQELFPGCLGPTEIHEIAAGLGSDIPFFLMNTTARGLGRGDILQPFSSPWSGPVLLCKPPFGVSTPWAYRSYAALREAGELAISSAPPRLWQNDLEAPVFRKFPVLAVLKNWLLSREEVLAAMMCGSGSTMLAALLDPGHFSSLSADLQAHFGSSFWTRLAHVGTGTAANF